MMKRLFSLNSAFLGIFGLCIALTGGAILMNGCQPPSVGYQVQQFAQIRIMNFAENCTVPLDIYWYPLNAKSKLDTAAKVNKLGYGQASVYYTSVPVATGGTVFHFIASPTGDKTGKSLKAQDITILPGVKYTWIITLAADNSGNFLSQFVTDDSAMQQSSSNNTFVRFINLQPNVGNLSLYVNDPASGQSVTPVGGEPFNGVSPYIALKTANDTSYAFFVTAGNSNSIIARLAYQSFAAGSYFTVIYSGDLCRTQAENPADTLNDKSDTLRLRVFDDNVSGSDQTYPPLPSFRFNIVNAYVPWSNSYGLNDDRIGFLLNGQGFPQYYNYTVSPVPLFHPGGTYVAMEANQQDTVWDVSYQSSSIPTPVDIKAYGTDANGQNQHPLFDINPSESGGYQSDKPVSFIIYDTVVPPPSGVTTLVKYAALAVPDSSNPNSVIFDLVAAIPPTKNATATAAYSSFWLNNGAWGADSLAPATLLNAGGGAAGGRQQIISFAVPAGTSQAFTIVDSIGKANVNRIGGPTKTFNAQAGGIYEIILTGTKLDPRLLILRVNP
jgi:hypothetical protein